MRPLEAVEEGKDLSLRTLAEQCQERLADHSPDGIAEIGTSLTA